MPFDKRDPSGPFDLRTEKTPGTEGKPDIIPTDSQNFTAFIDTALGQKEQPKFMEGS